MNGHTPGPWRLAGRGNSAGQLPIRDSGGRTLAGLTDGSLADGHLLASAPTAPHDCDIAGCPGAENKRKLEAFEDLLEALKNLVPLFAPHLHCHEDGCEWCEARAAIEKAEGR